MTRHDNYASHAWRASLGKVASRSQDPPSKPSQNACFPVLLGLASTLRVLRRASTTHEHTHVTTTTRGDA